MTIASQLEHTDHRKQFVPQLSELLRFIVSIQNGALGRHARKHVVIQQSKYELDQC